MTTSPTKEPQYSLLLDVKEKLQELSNEEQKEVLKSLNEYQPKEFLDRLRRIASLLESEKD